MRVHACVRLQREEEAQRECEARRRLEEVVREQRVLIDALSAETLTLRDESAALQVSHHTTPHPEHGHQIYSIYGRPR